MATELEIRAHLDTMRFLPLRLERLASSIGKTQWAGQPERRDLPSGMELTVRDREEIETRLRQLTEITTGTNLTINESAKARLSLLTKMLLAFPAAGSSSEAAAQARSDIYDDALGDMPPWAINAAIKRWARGEVPADPNMGILNFTFAPSPAILRKLAKVELGPFELQAAKLRALLKTIPIERAMDPKPIPQEVYETVGSGCSNRIEAHVGNATDTHDRVTAGFAELLKRKESRWRVLSPSTCGRGSTLAGPPKRAGRDTPKSGRPWLRGVSPVTRIVDWLRSAAKLNAGQEEVLWLTRKIPSTSPRFGFQRDEGQHRPPLQKRSAFLSGRSGIGSRAGGIQRERPWYCSR